MGRHFRLKHQFLKIIIGVSVFIFASCSSIDKERVSPAYFDAFESISAYFFQTANEDISPALVENIPYASAILRIGRGKPGLIILERKVNEKEYWVSADGVYIVLFKGKIIETSGLQHNLKSVRRDNYSYLDDNMQFINYYSFAQPKLLNLPVSISSSNKGKFTVDLLGRKKEMSLVEENLYNRTINWKAKNLYWYDNDGYLWKSEQNISPKLPTFFIEITKRPL